jgi:phosphomannomutase
MDRLGVSDSFEWLRPQQDPFFHGIGKEQRADGQVDDHSQDTTIIKRDKKTGEVTSIPVMERMGYDALLKDKPIGTTILMADPDGDRLVTAQLESVDRAEFLKSIGVDFLVLDEQRILALYTPNQSFLMTMAYQAQSLKDAGLWDDHPRFIIMTTASSAAWREWAERNGIQVLNVPVGFKEIAAMERKIEAQIKAHPDQTVIVKDIFGREVNLGVQPRLLFAGEESGGAVLGPEELIQSRHGRFAVAMREKSDGEMIVIQAAMAAYLESGNRFLSDYLESIFRENEIKGKYDVRHDKTYYNQNNADTAALMAEKKTGRTIKNA